MASDEVLFKVALDLSKVDSQFKDHSILWEKHTQDIAKGEKAMQDYANNTVKDYDKINKAVKTQISQVAAEGKVIVELDKKFQNLSKNNKDAFDSKELKDFDSLIKSLSKDMGSIESLNLSVDDIDSLISKLTNVEDDFGTLNVLVDFFEDKMKQASIGVVGSLDDIKEKIKETQLNIKSTEDFIKDSDKRIKSTAPGQDQANLISEREAAKKALNEEKVALEDYKLQLKEVRTENVSLATDLRKVKDELVKLELEGERGSARWNELKEKAIEYTTALEDTNAQLKKASSSTQGLDNLISAVNGVIGVFAVAEGAQALFGAGSEDLQKTLVKLNGALALLNGLQAIQAEVAKKGTASNKALAVVQGLYAKATDASAKSTLRLGAALKLLGIGLIVGLVAALVVYWKDVAKFIGITSDESERMKEVNEKANEIYGDQIAQLTLLNKKVKDGGLSFNQKEKAVKDFNDAFGDTLGSAKSYEELENRLINNGDKYIQYLSLKAQAEATYQIALEKTKSLRQDILRLEQGEGLGFFDEVTKYSDNASNSFWELFGIETINQNEISQEEILSIIGLPDEREFKNAISKYSQFIQSGLSNLREQNGVINTTLGSASDLESKFADLGKQYNILGDSSDKTSKKVSSLLRELVKMQEQIQTNLIDNDREKDKTLVTQRLEEEKKAFEERITALKASESEKIKIQAEFNKLYNKENGIAYEELRKQLNEIDAKYDAEREKVKFKALGAVASVYDASAVIERQNIQEKWKNIREELQKQIAQTDDEFEKYDLQISINTTVGAEKDELKEFDKDTDLEKIDKDQEIAESILKIYQANAKDLIDNEKLKQLQLLKIQEAGLEAKLQRLEKDLDAEQQLLVKNTLEAIKNAKSKEEAIVLGEKLREGLGDKTAKEILKTVEALKEVQTEIEGVSNKTEDSDLGSKISGLFSSTEGFAKGIGKLFGLSGALLNEFAEALGGAIDSVYSSLKEIATLEVEERKKKVEATQESIDKIEEEVEREKQLYEDGYANNYDNRQKDLESLKAQKAKEEEELKKAQKKRAAFAKTEFLIQTGIQLGNLVTSATNIFRVATKIGGPFAIPIAVAAIATMFGAFAIAKTKAFQAIGSGQNFRRGLKEGALDLHGPRHEESGFGLYNSKTGERVAEFEDSEKVYVVNKQQQRKYSHILDAMINDTQGGMSLEHYLSQKYGHPNVGEQTMQVIRRVNHVTIKSEQAKEEASKKSNETVNELRKLNEKFDKEFEGYKNERENEPKTWETPEYFYVKKGNITKKYPKNK
ncbi:hypothetical protein [Flavivirga jejuensis]|uniref:Chromosome segregation ATPase n=1 Tax=Flavivirga jejuensis TaxID=870487 RepID=A0ABT8WKD7_9FLAO|nr:hypothetical protein [Flavivirga jejuensis]MDO5973525.1 hypothetical protein [Flavivirga jejuensis]